MSEPQFRTIVGVIQFPPKDGNAGGKPVRNITVRQTGFAEQSVRVSATVWPSHSHVELKKDDVVVLEGKYSQNKTTADDGSPRVFHNLSVSQIAVLGSTDAGERVEVENAAETASDDDIPF